MLPRTRTNDCTWMNNTASTGAFSVRPLLYRLSLASLAALVMLGLPASGQIAKASIVLTEFYGRPGPYGRNVILNWSVSSATNNLGYYVYEATNFAGPYQKLNQNIISGGCSASCGYSFDTSPRPAGTYYYRLDDVDYNETVTSHGPFAVTLALQFLPIVVKPTPPPPPQLVVSPKIETYIVNGFFFMLGEFYNPYANGFQDVWVRGYNIDPLGTRHFGTTGFEMIPAGGKACYMVGVYSASGYGSQYGIDSAIGETPVVAPKLSITSESGAYNPSTRAYEVSAQIRNDSNSDICPVYLVATLYDAGDWVIGCEIWPRSSPYAGLHPGQTKTISAAFNFVSYAGVTHHQFRAFGYAPPVGTCSW